MLEIQMSMTYILYLSMMCVMEQTMCCNVWIEECENTLILFDCCTISDTVLLSGSFREERVCSEPVVGGPHCFTLAFGVSELLAVCQSVYPQGRGIQPEQAVFAAVLYFILIRGHVWD